MPSPTLGRYRLVERIATGGMGEVHRGVDVGWGGVERPVAVKLIAPEFARHPDFVQTFIDEAKLSFQLCHANVVQVRDIGRTDDTYFIAMEWVDGADLGTILRKLRQPLPLRFAVLVALEAARGLDYAHRLRDTDGCALNLVHRDVSPSNLMVSFEGEVKVTDFGIARWQMREAVSLPGALKGKIAYMSPEQARGEVVDARADVFSVGVVLYETITGKNPFTDGEREVDALARVRDGRFVPPSAVLPLPEGLEAIVLRAMAPDRERRYATAAALRDDLEAFARRESWALSREHLGQFVRNVLTDPDQLALADTDRNSQVPRRTPATPGAAPKPFDAALGAQLAALSQPDEEPEEPATTLPGRKRTVAVPPVASRTVAVHKIIDGPPVETTLERREPSPSEITDMIPLKRSPLIPIVALLGIGGVIAVAALAMRKEPAVAAPPPAPIAAAPVVTPSPVPRPVAAVAAEPPRPAARTPRPQPQPRATALARLSVSSDPGAQVYVDGEFVGKAPLTDYALAAGRHVVRVEGHVQGLRLMPKEETVILRDGESRRLPMELK